MLEFIKNKLIAVIPNIKMHHFSPVVHNNIEWFECFVDTLFCVLRKNEAYKVIKVKDCKLVNDSDRLSDRTYIIKIKYENKNEVITKTLAITLYWSTLTFNDASGFISVLKYTTNEIDDEIAILRAESTVPFLCN